MRTGIDNSVLEMALVGYSARRDEIIQKIADIERELGVRPRKVAAARVPARVPARVLGKTPTAEAEPKHNMSAAARRRISLAQKKRWAVYHAKTDAGKATTKRMTKQAAPRKAVSSDVRQRRIAALAKARAAKAAKRAAQAA